MELTKGRNDERGMENYVSVFLAGIQVGQLMLIYYLVRIIKELKREVSKKKRKSSKHR